MSPAHIHASGSAGMTARVHIGCPGSSWTPVELWRIGGIGQSNEVRSFSVHGTLQWQTAGLQERSKCSVNVLLSVRMLVSQTAAHAQNTTFVYGSFGRPI